MKICYFGTYEKDYPLNRILIKGLRKNNIEVLECNEPVWELTGNKTGDYLKIFSLLFLALRLISAYSRLTIKYFIAGDFDAVIVGYIGHLDIFLVKVLGFFKKRTIIFNPLISLYETLADDRELIKKGSIRAVLLHLLDKLTCRYSDIIILDTEEHIEYFHKEFGVKKEKCIRVFVGADEDIFHPLDNRKNEGSLFRVLFYGKYIPLHGIPVILNAAKYLEKDKEMEFVIIGEGQLSAGIEKLAGDLGLTNVSFAGLVPYVSLPGHIAGADVCLGVFSDNAKAGRVIPNKVFQAVAMKKTVITGDSPAIREIFSENKDIILCRRGDPLALAEALKTVKANHELRDRVAENAYSLFKSRLQAGLICGPLIERLRTF